MCVCMFICVYMFMYVYIYMHTCICLYIHTYMCVCICSIGSQIHAYMHQPAQMKLRKQRNTEIAKLKHEAKYTVEIYE